MQKLLIHNFGWITSVKVGLLIFNNITVNTRAFGNDLVSMKNVNLEQRISSVSSLTERI